MSAIVELLWLWNGLVLTCTFVTGDSEHSPITRNLTNLGATLLTLDELLSAGTLVAVAGPLAVLLALQMAFARGPSPAPTWSERVVIRVVARVRSADAEQLRATAGPAGIALATQPGDGTLVPTATPCASDDGGDNVAVVSVLLIVASDGGEATRDRRRRRHAVDHRSASLRDRHARR